MPNTYTQLHVQLVFAVKYRRALIHKSWKEELYKYITGIVQNKKHKHIFIGLDPNHAISDLVQLVKSESSKWINDNKKCDVNFSWQGGFGAFSYAKSQVEKVIKYIAKQEEHHKKVNFLDEYKAILKKLEMDFEEKYIFKELE
jgi:putative transposase